MAKQLSGAQKRKRKLEAERQAAAKKAAALGVPIVRPSAYAPQDGSDEFDQLGPPPLDNPEVALTWVRRYQLTALHVAATKPLTDSLRERLRFVKDFGATIGMTQNRSDLEELAERLEGSLAAIAPTGPVQMRPASANARPETSRGGSRSRGPRPVPGSPAGPDESNG